MYVVRWISTFVVEREGDELLISILINNTTIPACFIYFFNFTAELQLIFSSSFDFATFLYGEKMFSFLLSAVGVPNISNLSASTTTNNKTKKRNNNKAKKARKKNNVNNNTTVGIGNKPVVKNNSG